jgi:phospholipase C
MLSDSGQTWKSYFHDVAFNWVLGEAGGFLSPNIDSYELHFQHDLDGDSFPAYAFIEPAYVFFPNDEHPPHDVTNGEALIADVYNRIRRSNYWSKTLLIITYDEHGGCYDHVTPPPAVPPDALPDPLPFDHTTIIRTLTNLFGLRLAATGHDYLTERDRNAPDLGDYLTLTAAPDNNPGLIPPPKVPFHCKLHIDLSDEGVQKFLLIKHAMTEAHHESSATGDVPAATDTVET